MKGFEYECVCGHKDYFGLRLKFAPITVVSNLRNCPIYRTLPAFRFSTPTDFADVSQGASGRMLAPCSTCRIMISCVRARDQHIRLREKSRA